METWISTRWKATAAAAPLHRPDHPHVDRGCTSKETMQLVRSPSPTSAAPPRKLPCPRDLNKASSQVGTAGGERGERVSFGLDWALCFYDLIQAIASTSRVAEGSLSSSPKQRIGHRDCTYIKLADHSTLWPPRSCTASLFLLPDTLPFSFSNSYLSSVSSLRAKVIRFFTLVFRSPFRVSNSYISKTSSGSHT